MSHDGGVPTATPTVILTCGLTCSGKTTYARQLESRGWVRLSVDDEAWRLGHREQPLPADVQRDIKIRQKEALRAHVAAGRDVVVDYALVSRDRREEYRAIAEEAGARVRIVYFDVPADELHRRLAARNAGPRSADTVVVDPERLDRWIATFEPPGPDEHDVVTIHWNGSRDGAG